MNSGNRQTPSGEMLLKVEYDSFKKQGVDEKLNTLFIKIERIAEGTTGRCMARARVCGARFDNIDDEMKKVGRWSKLYAVIGGLTGSLAFLITALLGYFSRVD